MKFELVDNQGKVVSTYMCKSSSLRYKVDQNVLAIKYFMRELSLENLDDYILEKNKI